MTTYQDPRPSASPFYTLDGQYKANAADVELEKARIRACQAREAARFQAWIARNAAEVA